MKGWGQPTPPRRTSTTTSCSDALSVSFIIFCIDAQGHAHDKERHAALNVVLGDATDAKTNMMGDFSEWQCSGRRSQCCEHDLDHRGARFLRARPSAAPDESQPVGDVVPRLALRQRTAWLSVPNGVAEEEWPQQTQDTQKGEGSSFCVS